MQTGKRRRQNVIASDEEEEEESANAGEDDTTIKLEISPEKNKVSERSIDHAQQSHDH